MVGCPFSSDQQLYSWLATGPNGSPPHRISKPKTAPKPETAPKPGTAPKTFLPGCPRVQLDDQTIGDYLEDELITEQLDDFEPYLWLVAKQDSSHISSLTKQIVRGRTIIITEEPRLHLVWAYNRVFIKPLPKYLLSRVFWDYYLLSTSSPIREEKTRKKLQLAARGLLRCYAYLIQYKSDFLIAQDESTRLIPKDICYSDFIRFIEHCKVPDELVSPRFRFGELRLTRLNLWTKVFLRGFNYSKVEWQYSDYIARHYAPVLFIFAVFSVLLAALQVVLAVHTLDEESRTAATDAYRQFSLFIFYFVCVIVAVLITLIIALFGRELIFALKDLFQNRVGRLRARRG